MGKYRTADDVFNSVLRGDKALSGSREALGAMGPRDPVRAMAAEYGTPLPAERATGPEANENARNHPKVPPENMSSNPSDLRNRSGSVGDFQADFRADPTAAGIERMGVAPERYFSRRDLGDVTPQALPESLPYPALMVRARQFLAQQRAAGRTMTNADTGITVGMDRASAKRPIANRGPDLLRAVPLIPDVVERGAYLGSVPGDARHPHVVALHTFGARVHIGGQPRDLIVTARETRDGRFLYSFDADQSVLRNPADTLPDAKAPDALLTQVPHSKKGQEVPGGDQDVTTSDPDIKNSLRPAPLLSDKPALEREGQGAMFDRSARQAQQARDDAGGLTSGKAQRAAEDLPLSDRMMKEQPRLLVLREDDASRRWAALGRVNQAVCPDAPSAGFAEMSAAEGT